MAGKKRRKDEGRALSAAYFSKQVESAEKGDLDALHDVAARYATGDWPATKDEAKAVELYTKAAERGHSESQYDLGFMLILGEGTEKDEVKGLWWMEQAAVNGCAPAARFLSDAFNKGYYDVEIDKAKAVYWAKREQELNGQG
jgi:TPR repeat protein